MEISFDPTRVRRYNDTKFDGNSGIVTGVSRFGLTVSLPNEQKIFVNFEDVL